MTHENDRDEVLDRVDLVSLLEQLGAARGLYVAGASSHAPAPRTTRPGSHRPRRSTISNCCGVATRVTGAGPRSTR
jgi:hypothetical protein